MGQGIVGEAATGDFSGGEWQSQCRRVWGSVGGGVNGRWVRVSPQDAGSSEHLGRLTTYTLACHRICPIQALCPRP